MSYDAPAVLDYRGLAVATNHPGDTLYRLRYLGDPILAARCLVVRSAGEIPPGLIDAMRGAMCSGSVLRSLRDTRSGLGLAANQVGALVRIILVKIANDPVATVMVNPVIVTRSLETAQVPEGCLSIPGFQTNIARHTAISVTYQDEQLRPHTLHLSSLTAQVVQHEVDHLDGKMLTDGLSRQLRRQAERALAKAAG